MDNLKEKLREFWEESDLIQVPAASAQELGFSDGDACILAEIGLPAWSAPNMHLHSPRLSDNGRILIGQDRNDFSLLYEKGNRQIVARTEQGEDVLVATSLQGLLTILIEYARMVDAAILVNGERAFVDNNIPNHLIDNFEGAIDAALSGASSIWTNELQRLRSHMPSD